MAIIVSFLILIRFFRNGDSVEITRSSDCLFEREAAGLLLSRTGNTGVADDDVVVLGTK